MRDLGSPSHFLPREVMFLALLTALAVGGFAVTRAVAARDRRAGIEEAAALYARGVQQLQEGRVDEAVGSLRMATTKDRGNATYAPTLARALAAAGRTDESRQVLLQLRDLMPEDPGINVELARVAASRQDLSEAVRYYHSALYGVWPSADPVPRERLHVELIRLLLRQNRPSDALAELVTLGTNLRDTAAAHLEVGQLLLSAGDEPRARDQFARALTLEPDSQEARAGIGEAAFGLGDYAVARRYLNQVADPSPRIAGLRDVAALVLATDPLAPRLALAERRRRALVVTGQLLRRIDACAAQPAGQASDAGARLEVARAEIRALERQMRPAILRDSPETIDSVVEASLRIEKMAEGCGEASPLDQAVVLIGQRQGATPR